MLIPFSARAVLAVVSLSLAAAATACNSSNSAPNDGGEPSADAPTDQAAPRDAGTTPDAVVESAVDASADGPIDQAAPLDSGTADDGSADAPSGETGPWMSGPALPVARIQSFTAAPGNGYIYSADGYVNNTTCSGGTADGRVFYAKQNADGSLGAWAETTVGPTGFKRTIPGHVDANGFIYMAGGAIDAPSWDGNIWFAKPAADGSIPMWTEATHAVLTWLGSGAVMTVSSGVVFLGGGFNTFASPQWSKNLFMSTLDATTGQPGVWMQLTPLPETPTYAQLVTSAAGYAYYVQGANEDVWITTVAALTASAQDGGALPADGGDAGSIWTLSPTPLPANANVPDAFIVESTLYVALGNSPDIYQSQLQADGSLGPWSLYTQAPVTFTAGYQGLVSNGFYYLIGDDYCNATTAQGEATYYLRMP